MTFVSCGEKKSAQNTEEPIVGTDYVVVTTPTGAKGIKKGDAILVTPTDTYKSIAVDNGMFLAKTDGGYSLLDPETGYSVLDADTISWKSFYFEGQKSENYLVYIPAYKCRFAAQAYAVKGGFAISSFNGKITAYKDGQPIIEPTGDFAKMAILPDGKFLVLKGKSWVTATLKGKTLFPSKAVTPRDLKKYQKMKGWDEKSPVMILE